MKVKSTKQKGLRIFKSRKHKFNNSNQKTIRPFWIEPIENDYWFDIKSFSWIKNPKTYVGLQSSYYAMKSEGLTDAYSLKAVIRLINKFNVPKGTVFRASLPFIGYDFYLTKN